METAILRQQYDWVKQSREVLFSYAATLSERDFLQENSAFGRGSVRNLLVHIATTYQFWIGKQALKKDIEFTKNESVKTIGDTRAVFENIDRLLEEFFSFFETRGATEIVCALNGNETTASPLKLFSHVVTHEFHHKGQILSLSRHLGYVPVDTDIMR